MKARNFSNLGGSSAAALNAGTIGIQKDKVVHLDPVSEILYDPTDNIRNGKLVDDSIEGLISLRLTMDGSEQLQPIRVYLLPPEKLDPARPAMKYGIGYGNRRTLACRLTNADYPEIGDKPRKVAAIIDLDWLKKGRSYRLRCQIHENTAKLDLNPVEFGQALLDYQRELGEEEKRHVSQRELMAVYGLREKTVYNLLKAAEFHPVAKEVCHRQFLSDLDTLVTFDIICKTNTAMGQAIYESLQQEGAPSNRSLIRQARILAEDKDYVFEPSTWSWPESVEQANGKQGPTLTPPPETVVGVAGSSPQMPSGTGPGASADPQNTAGAGSQGKEDGGQQNSSDERPPAAPKVTKPEADGKQPGNTDSPEGSAGATGAEQRQPPAPRDTPEPPPAASTGKGPIIMVEFRMGAEAKTTFTGELLIGKRAKGASNGVVVYLNEGREEQIEVPLKLISLVSINH